ncbi:phosphotransferase [Kribbella sp. NBC_01245]|uniref:phosphotransferase n=1 Tax=Kribbella sp. NBC_01245 TaxID=2903578 RepID=UPI002E283791|nr:phosphotransferase [Kribbella sp. NBC_01245]
MTDDGLATIQDNGWDSKAWTDGVWLYRDPRRPEVVPRLLAEAALLPWLAPQLPLTVPVPELTATGVRHRLLPGVPLEDAPVGKALGSFLRALHAVDPAEAVQHSAQDAEAAHAERSAVQARMAAEVLPRLPEDVRRRGEDLLAEIAQATYAQLVHGDLGPDHILVTGDAVTGVIDWTDAHIGDPALDLSWLLYGAEPIVAEAVAASYEPDQDVKRRALAWHRLGPWYEVLFGLDTERPELVQSGLAGVTSRLVQP